MTRPPRVWPLEVPVDPAVVLSGNTYAKIQISKEMMNLIEEGDQICFYFVRDEEVSQ